MPIAERSPGFQDKITDDGNYCNLENVRGYTVEANAGLTASENL